MPRSAPHLLNSPARLIRVRPGYRPVHPIIGRKGDNIVRRSFTRGMTINLSYSKAMSLLGDLISCVQK
jgi:hypothetical protein